MKFICGMPRAGSTLLSSLLNQNPDITVSGQSIIPEIFFRIEEIKKLKERIRVYLMSYPETQDSNEALMSIIWQQETDKYIINAGNHNINPLVLLKSGKLTSWDSATRAKRKLQEEHPELRGQSYNLRKAKAVKVSKNVGSLFGDNKNIH